MAVVANPKTITVTVTTNSHLIKARAKVKVKEDNKHKAKPHLLVGQIHMQLMYVNPHFWTLRPLLTFFKGGYEAYIALWYQAMAAQQAAGGAGDASKPPGTS